MDSWEGGNKEDKDNAKHHAGHGYRGMSQRESTGLRRPHSTNLSSNATNMEHNQEEKKSMLSPQAAEFYPRYKQSVATSDGGYQSVHTAPRTASVQNRLQLARETPPQNIFSPLLEISLEDVFQQQCATGNSETRSQNGYKNKDSVKDNREKPETEGRIEVVIEIFRRLNILINILTANPAEFTELVPEFVNHLRKTGNMDCLHLVLKSIIDSSITESNFRYSGARFCKYFAGTANDSSDQCMLSRHLFQDLLHTECKLETLLYEPDCSYHHLEECNQKRCNALVLFLAELVAQMDEPYAFLLGELLVQFISKILKRPGSNSVKYICQALKLAGYVLEKDKTRSKDMENMMRALTDLVNNGQVDKHVGNMVSNVHELRKDWGKGVSYDSSGKSNVKLLSEMQQQPGRADVSNCYTYEADGAVVSSDVDQPVLYGPDGTVLSVDEEQFLRETQNDIGTSDDEDVDEHYSEEMATAYEEQFLKDLMQKHQNKN